MKNPTIYPVHNPKATLLIVHGMAEHQGRYVELAQFLVNHDIAVMTFDHLGHGQLAKDNNCLGYIGNPNPAELMITDVMTYASQIAEQFPNVPHFILGHSMGSFVTRCIIQRFGNTFDGAIIMGTSSPNLVANGFLPITRIMNKVSPYQRNPIFDKILGSINNVPFRHESSLGGFNWLNSHANGVKKYLSDPLCGFTFSNNGFFALISLMNKGTNKNWWQTVPKNLPIFFVSGEDDPVGQMGKGIPKIVKGLENQGFIAITAKQYRGMRHEILLEDNKQMVYDDILNWLLEHC